MKVDEFWVVCAVVSQLIFMLGWGIPLALMVWDDRKRAM